MNCSPRLPTETRAAVNNAKSGHRHGGFFRCGWCDQESLRHAITGCSGIAAIRETTNYTGPMSIESIPNFTKPALALWSRISSEHKKLLLANVWCGACRHEVIITNFTGAVKSGDLLLVGKCAECHGDVARVIESE